MPPALATALDVRTAILERRSVRGFLPDDIPLATVRRLLDDAARAPSGTNTQPWRVHVARGKAKERLTAAVTAAALAGPQSHEYRYSPDPLPEPYLSRRRKVGFYLYGIAGIERGDMEGRKRQSLKNYTFFGAPVGLFFTLDRRLDQGSWIDVGMLMQNVMILARAAGLETCPQAAWIYYGPTVHAALGIPDNEVLISGMALGYPDWSVAENNLRTERIPSTEFAVIHDD